MRSCDGFFRRYHPLRGLSALSLGLIFALALAGCGGGGNNEREINPTPTPSASPTPFPTPTPTPPAVPVAVRTSIIWGPRSRQVNTQLSNNVGGPSAALSATISFAGARPDKSDLTYTVNRGVLNGAQEYSSAPVQATPGNYILTVNFYANADGTGARVGTAQASTQILADGTLDMTIATVGAIARLVVTPGQAVGLNQNSFPVYTAFGIADANGVQQVIALTPGSAFVNELANAMGVRGDIAVSGEQITGVTPGTARISVTVDGVTSAVETVAIRSDVALSITPAAPTVSRGLTQTFTATIANDGQGAESGVTWTYTGVGALVTVDGFSAIYTAPLTDGTATLVATSNYDPNVSVTVPITVSSLVAVAITPNPVPVLSVRAKQQLTAAVAFVPAGQDAGVTWSVVGGNANGTVTQDGIYTAPSTPGTYTVVATSKFDPLKTGTVSITVQDGSVTVIVN